MLYCLAFVFYVHIKKENDKKESITATKIAPSSQGSIKKIQTKPVLGLVAFVHLFYLSLFYLSFFVD